MRRPPLSLLGGVGVSTALLAALLLPPLALGSAAAGSPAAGPAAAPRVSVATARVKLQPVVSGLSSPVAIAFRGSDATHMYVAQQPGSIVVVRSGRVLQTVLTLNVAHGSEQGLLGIAFSNDGEKLYVDYNDPSGDLHIAEYSMKGLVANAASRRLLLTIPHHTYSNHNGGDLVIGSDNMLYITVGDGGSGGDPNGNGQNKNVMLGKILRIDPRKNGASPFRIPADNPFHGKPGFVQSIWMYGLRNPWRFSFDRSHARHMDRRRRPGQVRGDRLRARRRRRASTGVGTSARASTPTTAARGRPARTTRSSSARTPRVTAPSSAATSTEAGRTSRWSVRTCSATSAPEWCARSCRAADGSCRARAWV